MSTPRELELRVRRLENDRDDAYGELTRLSRKIDQKVDNLGTDVSALGTKVTALDTKVTALDTKVDTGFATVAAQLADLPEIKVQLAVIMAALSTGPPGPSTGA